MCSATAVTIQICQWEKTPRRANSPVTPISDAKRQKPST